MSSPINKTSRRAIVEGIGDLFKTITLGNGYQTDLGGEVFTKMVFWDELNEYPAVCIVAGPETIIHQGAGYKDRYLDIIIRIYVNDEDSVLALERLLEDIEIIIDNNGRLAYLDSSGALQTTRDIIITFIDTDQGTLAPFGVGEMTLQVKY